MLKEALEDWNPWWEESNVPETLKGKSREILSEIQPSIQTSKIKIITGVRRSGKSTLFYQLIDNLLKVTRAKNILLLNFDDVRLSVNDLERIYKEFIELKKPDEIYLFLDEVHNAKNWVSLIRRLADLRKANIFITDSSSYFIPHDYAKILTGRKLSFELYPLSFREYLNFKNIRIEAFGTEENAKIRGYLKEYMQQGGFPELFALPKRYYVKTLIEYFEDIITKDVVSRYSVDYRKVRDLSYYLLSTIGQRVTYRKLKNVFNMGLETVKRYLEFMEQVYLIFKVSNYSEKVKEQIITPKKVYAIDTGLSNAVGFKTFENLGPTLENLVFLELKRRNYAIFYLKIDNREIDFVVKKGLEIVDAINVCYDPSDTNTRDREVKSMLLGLRKLKLKKGKILTWEYEETIKINTKIIEFVPVYKWLLQQDALKN
ncbi:MAG: ATP-binding protein [Candidatus Odinarchaeota archaeon]|nr:ATP-binding protein [Candidatus Odinarchaeota archaeon]